MIITTGFSEEFVLVTIRHIAAPRTTQLGKVPLEIAVTRKAVDDLHARLESIENQNAVITTKLQRYFRTLPLSAETRDHPVQKRQRDLLRHYLVPFARRAGKLGSSLGIQPCLSFSTQPSAALRTNPRAGCVSILRGTRSRPTTAERNSLLAHHHFDRNEWLFERGFRVFRCTLDTVSFGSGRSRLRGRRKAGARFRG